MFTWRLSRLDYSAEATFKPNVPRIYSTFKSFDGQVISLTFKSRLKVWSKNPESKLLFLATSSQLSQQLLVKFIAGEHGTDAHRAIAKAGYAPTLFGVSKVEGALTAYIMEYLSPTDGWQTLHDYAKQHQDVKSRIKNQVDQLLEIMDNARIVHGDLRPNNIMIRHSRGEAEPQLKVVDFDWSGESGKVKYPLRRNEEIPWPAGPGEPIIDGHDKTLLMACLSQIGR
jgi:serine/threonine protein kinase